jgi:hypothetical protein
MATHSRVIVADFEGRAERVSTAERRLYEAEFALHIAHQTHVDAWISAASDRLHDALVDHLAAIRAA